jgi:hypothetical protein
MFGSNVEICGVVCIDDAIVPEKSRHYITTLVFVIGSVFFIWSVTLFLICIEHKSLAAFRKTLLIAFVCPPSSSLPIRMSMHCTLLSKRASTCAKNVLYVNYDASQWKKTGPKNIGLSLDDFFTTFMISEEANLVL